MFGVKWLRIVIGESIPEIRDVNREATSNAVPVRRGSEYQESEYQSSKGGSCPTS